METATSASCAAFPAPASACTAWLDARHATAVAADATQDLIALAPSRRPSSGAPIPASRRRNKPKSAAALTIATIEVLSASPACPIPAGPASSSAAAAFTAIEATLTSIGVRASFSA